MQQLVRVLERRRVVDRGGAARGRPDRRVGVEEQRKRGRGGEVDAAAAYRALTGAPAGTKAVLQTQSLGYDGKGQVKITSADQAEAAFASAGAQEMILEAWVDFACELSVIGARGSDGSFTHWGVIRNDNRNHILDVSIAPAGLPPEIEREAIAIARAALEQLDVIGVLCVEFFLTADGRLLINELAPRPHNSGHLTFDACRTSQFEQQPRAICGLPLGSPELLQPAGMAHLLGDAWDGGIPAVGSREELELAKRLSEALAARLGPVVEELQPGTVDPPERPRRLRKRLTWLFLRAGRLDRE